MWVIYKNSIYVYFTYLLHIYIYPPNIFVFYIDPYIFLLIRICLHLFFLGNS